MVTQRTKLTPEERKQLHAELARGPEVVQQVAEAKADYEKARGNGELHRTGSSQRNRRAGKR